MAVGFGPIADDVRRSSARPARHGKQVAQETAQSAQETAKEGGQQHAQEVKESAQQSVEDVKQTAQESSSGGATMSTYRTH